MDPHSDLDPLRRLCPWPAARPDLPEDFQGWFGRAHEQLLGRFLGPRTRFVVELGSWKGLSTRFLLQAAPSAAVVAVDTWEGSAEHHADPRFAGMLPTLHDQFLANLWPWRDRLYPLRRTTTDGMLDVAALGLRADLVYVDAAHDTKSVLADLRWARMLFPDAMLVGDDWNWDTVRAAAEQFAAERGFSLEVVEPAWTIKSS